MTPRKKEATDERLWRGLWPLGLAALLATSLLYIPSFAFTTTLGSPASFAVNLSFVGCAAMVLTGIAAAVVYDKKGRLGGRPLQIAGGAAYVLGSAGLVVAASLDSAPFALVAAVGILQGFGGFSLYLAWGLAYRKLGLRSNFLYIAASVGAAVLIGLALTQLLSQIGLAAFLILSAVAGGVPLSPAAAHDGPSKPDDEPDSKPASTLAALRDVGKAIHSPTYGLVILAFTDAVMGIDSLAQLNRPAEVAGFCMAAFIFLFLSAQRFDKPMLPFVYRVMLPAMVLLMFGARMLSDEGVLAHEVFDVLFFALYGSVTVLAFSHLVAILRAGELPAVPVVAFVYTSYGLAALAGMGLWELMSTWGVDPRVFMLITWIAYFAYLALSPAVQNWQRLVRDQQSGQEPLPQAPAIDWGLFGERYGLSQRESEIMGYLGRGHSSTFISQTLVISDNTVRTHTRHIYRKVGVTSRDELLKAVSDFGRESAAAASPEDGRA